MTLTWLVGATIVLVACFVQGLAGFGIGLVALAFLPFMMAPATAVVLMTVYAAVLILVIFLPLRREFLWADVRDLLIGTIAGVPVGVWVLASLPASALNRLIGLALIGVVLLEVGGRYPRLHGRVWAIAFGFASGAVGGAIGTPGPPVIIYATMQSWTPRTMKANIQAFLVVNQLVTVTSYWWAGLVTREVLVFAAAFSVPAVAGVLAGMALFDRIDPVRFRRLVFGLLFVSGIVLLVRG
jgi:uncharacterized membrane protein YfcA